MWGIGFNRRRDCTSTTTGEEPRSSSIEPMSNSCNACFNAGETAIIPITWLPDGLFYTQTTWINVLTKIYVNPGSTILKMRFKVLVAYMKKISPLDYVV